MKTRNPWVAAFLNLFWGLGYLYAGRRKLVGVSLLAMIGAWMFLAEALVRGVLSAGTFYLLAGGVSNVCLFGFRPRRVLGSKEKKPGGRERMSNPISSSSNFPERVLEFQMVPREVRTDD